MDSRGAGCNCIGVDLGISEWIEALEISSSCYISKVMDHNLERHSHVGMDGAWRVGTMKFLRVVSCDAFRRLIRGTVKDASLIDIIHKLKYDLRS